MFFFFSQYTVTDNENIDFSTNRYFGRTDNWNLRILFIIGAWSHIEIISTHPENYNTSIVTLFILISVGPECVHKTPSGEQMLTDPAPMT